jgi:hypothetical protein
MYLFIVVYRHSLGLCIYPLRESARRSMAMTACIWFPREGRVPHISLVFREMWDTTGLSL